LRFFFLVKFPRIARIFDMPSSSRRDVVARFTRVGAARSSNRRPIRVAVAGLACLVALAIPRSVSPQGTPLHLVSTAWPPFTNPPGEPQFALDLVNEALRRIQVAAETTIVDESRFTPSALAVEFDGSAAVWKDAERDQLLLFSEPYLENRLILVGRQGSDVSATSLATLTGKRIVLVGNYSYGDQVKEGTGPIFLRSRSEEDSLAKLLANEADYTLMDELVVKYLVRNYPDQARDRLQVGATPLIVRPLYFAIRRSRPGAEGIISRFNGELRRMVLDRTYHRLLQLDWIQADIDGDGRLELVADSDQVGPAAPERPYSLFVAAPAVKGPAASSDQRFYVGGSIYENWASVPENYKSSTSTQPDPARNTASLFRFSW
jgi:ABC-type amino acid transport substrate-binding protein